MSSAMMMERTGTGLPGLGVPGLGSSPVGSPTGVAGGSNRSNVPDARRSSSGCRCRRSAIGPKERRWPQPRGCSQDMEHRAVAFEREIPRNPPSQQDHMNLNVGILLEFRK